MSNAVEPAFERDDDEEGVAESAASLGVDGGPVVAVNQGVDDFDEDLDEIEDDAWLDEELSDEELAALGEEDFDISDISDEELSAALAEADFDHDEGFSASFDDDGADDDADNFDYDPNEAAEQLAAPETEEIEAPSQPPVESDASSDVAAGALVEAGATMVAGADYGDSVTDIVDDEVDHRPVPRISIHAFCESPATTSLLEKAAVDRRLNKAHLTIHLGGISKAVDQFQTTSTPNLIILETTAAGSEIFQQLNALAEVCDPSTKVVIIGQVNDIILYRELIRQGISEYIVRPNSPLQIIKAIADLYVDPSAPPIGRTIAFVGARGGVGSSTIAHNVGWCAAEEFQSDTVILDLDLPFGTASLDFDQEASAGLVEALSSPERLDDVLLDRLLQKHTEHLSLFTAPSILDRDYDIDDQAFETVIDVVRATAPTIIVDVPHMWTSWSKRILTTADEIVVTATPDLAAFRNTKNLIDILSSARPNDAAPTLIINQYDPKLSAVQPDQFEEHVGLKAVQVLPFEPQLFGAAATNAEPILEVGPKSKTAQSLRELSAKLIGRGESEIAKPKFSLTSLFKGKR
ncbi:MAG: AAA family ATPase [Marinicaulis sp.]|nr:AAA family ATPase [Marinicaulis sp.]NNE39748.1 AAA family ATPase [Marinicaulis sp.]NNL87630.1 AAA family ATPase [Marinicaulis sp.]